MASDGVFVSIFLSSLNTTMDGFFDRGETFFSRIVREIEECLALLNGDTKSRRGAV